MKKIIFLFAAAVLALAFFVGCGTAETNSDGRLNIVATTFPPYDCTRAITGDAAELTMLLSPETESHGFEPTLKEIALIQNCDVFICIGGTSEKWVDTLLAQADTSEMTVIRLIDCIDPADAVLAAGSHHHEDDEHCEHDAYEYDEHIWTSPRNVILMAETVRDALCSRDEANASLYSENCTAYINELSKLDAELTELTANAKRRTLIFAERFPFAYLAAHYSLEYHAAFQGCSSDSEPSLAAIASLTEIIQQEDIPYVFYIEFSDQTAADTLCSATGAQKRLLHSCHNLTQEEFGSGITYLELMDKNIDTLREALN